MRPTNPYTEGIKDALYRWFGAYPPHPPMRVELSPPTQVEQKSLEQLKTICIFLGPHRNLTTLTASVLALHPNCQILSHAGPRVFPVVERNFLDDYSEEKMNNFLHFAYVMSQTADRGEYGGSITVTHPFRDHEIIRETYRKRYGRKMVKDRVDCLIWKEAHLVQNYVDEHIIDLGTILEKNDKLRLIMPVRNPLHVALSFFSRDRFMDKFYKHLDRNDLESVLDDILGKMSRTIELSEAHPKQVMVFFENEISKDLFVRMADFLNISPDALWIKDTLRCFDVQPAVYDIGPELQQSFMSKVKTLFGNSPSALSKFEQYF
jgi:hypothetical protein